MCHRSPFIANLPYLLYEQGEIEVDETLATALVENATPWVSNQFG